MLTKEPDTLKTRSTTSTVVTEADLAGLPAPVQRYMRYSGVVGQPWIETARVRYSGRFRMALDKPWLPIQVDQVYRTDPPAFLWKARFKFYGLPLMRATDTFRNGHGHMLGKLAGLFTVVDGQGDEVDQGTMIRYLQEMAWFPSAYLGQNITWGAVDDHAADVTLNDSGKSVTGRMYFDDTGRMLSFSAQRYGEFEGRFEIRTWTAPMTEYGEFNGLKLPVVGRGVWQLPAYDLAYVEVQVQDIVFNQAINDF